MLQDTKCAIIGLILLFTVKDSKCACMYSFSLKTDICYIISTSSLNWHKSRAECRKQNYDLVTVLSDDEFDYINELVQNTNTFYWLGGSTYTANSQPSNNWIWPDGQYIKFFKWRTDQLIDGCLTLDSNNKKWISKSCSTAQQLYICSKYRRPSSTFSRCISHPTPRATDEKSHYCFTHHKTVMNYTSARQACLFEQSTLAYLESHSISVFVNKLIQNKKFWIGAVRNSSNWMWENGISINGNIDLENSSDKCASFDSGVNKIFKLKSTSCSEIQSFVCMKSEYEPTLLEKNGCPATFGFGVSEDKCYRHFVNMTTWPESINFCKKRSLTEATIDTSNDKKALLLMISTINNNVLWIGANGTNETVTWLRNTSDFLLTVKYTNQTIKNNPHCITMQLNQSDIQFEGQMCSSLYQILCMKSRETPITLTTENVMQVKVNSNIKLQCIVQNRLQNPIIRWRKNGEEINNTMCFKDSCIHTVTNVAMQDIGSYSCELIDSFNNTLVVSYPLELNVIQFIIDTSDKLILTDQRVTFDCTVKSSINIRYTAWFMQNRKVKNCSDAKTCIYTINTPKMSDNGKYICRTTSYNYPNIYFSDPTLLTVIAIKKPTIEVISSKNELVLKCLPHKSTKSQIISWTSTPIFWIKQTNRITINNGTLKAKDVSWEDNDIVLHCTSSFRSVVSGYEDYTIFYPILKEPIFKHLLKVNYVYILIIIATSAIISALIAYSISNWMVRKGREDVFRKSSSSD